MDPQIRPQSPDLAVSANAVATRGTKADVIAGGRGSVSRPGRIAGRGTPQGQITRSPGPVIHSVLVSWRRAFAAFCAGSRDNVICITIARDNDAYNTWFMTRLHPLIPCPYTRHTRYDPIPGYERSDVGGN